MEYATKDFYISCCLRASGLSLVRLEKDKDKTVFVFNSPNKKASEIIKDHWSGKLLIPTKILIDAIHELKTRLHNGV